MGGLIGAGLQIAGVVVGQSEAEANAKAQGEAVKQQAQNAIRGMNHEFQNYEMERQDAFDSAVQEITNTRLAAMQLGSQVEAAINEEMSGRTADLLKRNVKGDEARAIDSVKDNYERRSNEIDLNKETSLINTKAYVAGMKAPRAPSRLGALINIASIGVNAYTSAMNSKTDALSKGMDWDYHKGAVPKKGG